MEATDVEMGEDQAGRFDLAAVPTLRPSDVALIQDHLALVEHIAMRMAAGFPRHVDRSELVSAGTVGLIDAARRFEPERGVRFGDYAAVRIRGAVLDFVRSCDWAPRSVRHLARLADEAELRLVNRNGQHPSVEEVAREMGIGTADLVNLRERINRGTFESLDRESSAESGTGLDGPESLATWADPEQSIEDAEEIGYLRDAVRALPERHRVVISGYFLEGKTSEQIATELGVTQSRVSQLRADALVMMREGLEAQYAGCGSTRPKGRVERRKSSYARAIAAGSTWRGRLESAAVA